MADLEDTAELGKLAAFGGDQMKAKRMHHSVEPDDKHNQMPKLVGGDSTAPSPALKQMTAQPSASKKKRNLFEEFNQMIRHKYQISDDMYNQMSYKDRNQRLKKMLDG